jgi:hypothetical protein
LKTIFHACSLVEKIILSLENIGKNNKEPKKIKFVVVELRGERKVKESNHYSRGKQDLERRKRWVRGCTADAGLGAVTETTNINSI